VDVLVVEVARVVEVVEALVEVLDTVEAIVLVTLPPKALTTAVYAGCVVKSAYHRQASPWPEKTDGIQEYLSVKSQTVIPTHPVTARQELTTFT
jgi:hypothetical protein